MAVCSVDPAGAGAGGGAASSVTGSGEYAMMGGVGKGGMEGEEVGRRLRLGAVRHGSAGLYERALKRREGASLRGRERKSWDDGTRKSMR